MANKASRDDVVNSQLTAFSRSSRCFFGSSRSRSFWLNEIVEVPFPFCCSLTSLSRSAVIGLLSGSAACSKEHLSGD